MKNENTTQELCQEVGAETCGGRREFLVKATAIAGGVVLSLSGLSAAQAQKDKDKDKKKDGDTMNEDLVLKLDASSPLSKVGGTDTVETKSAGKVIIVRNGEMSFAAFHAKCPHKGGPIKYDEKTKQLFCPWHGSRFDAASGNVLKDPAKEPLTAFTTNPAVVVSVTPKS
ncbi:MAG: Rieske 2Fe-2S domain-containing protein [Actinomycetota bacterium]